jgi:hypothetical protein
MVFWHQHRKSINLGIYRENYWPVMVFWHRHRKSVNLRIYRGNCMNYWPVMVFWHRHRKWVYWDIPWELLALRCLCQNTITGQKFPRYIPVYSFTMSMSEYYRSIIHTIPTVYPKIYWFRNCMNYWPVMVFWHRHRKWVYWDIPWELLACNGILA